MAQYAAFPAFPPRFCPLRAANGSERQFLAIILILATIAACVLAAKPELFRSLFPDEKIREKVALYGFATYVVLLIVVVFSSSGMELVYRR